MRLINDVRQAQWPDKLNPFWEAGITPACRSTGKWEMMISGRYEIHSLCGHNSCTEWINALSCFQVEIDSSNHTTLYLSGSGLDLKSLNQFYRVWLRGNDNQTAPCHIPEQKITEERMLCRVDAAELPTEVYIFNVEVSLDIICTWLEILIDPFFGSFGQELAVHFQQIRSVDWPMKPTLAVFWNHS